MNAFRNLHDWIAERPRQTIGLRILQIAFGLALLFRVFTEGPYSLYLWGPHGLGAVSTADSASPTFRGIASIVCGSNVGAFAIVAMLGLGALGLITGTRTVLATAFTYFGLVLLEARLPELADGGDNIMRICLIYMLFTLPAGRAARPRTLRVWLHNVAVLAIASQVCILYMASGFQKAFGERWHTGVAMYYITRSMWFSQPAIAPLFENPVLTAAATYGPILHQVWFPIAILSPLRLPWIVIGVVFHVGIASLMGLVTFSIAMIGLELFFVTDGEYRRLQSAAVRWRDRFLDIAPRLWVRREPGLAVRMRTASDSLTRLARRLPFMSSVDGSGK